MLAVGTKFQISDVTFEVTQIGKECHRKCAIYHQVGDCIMPKEGIFARVLKGGIIKAGDEIVIL
jgi:molybdopterin adenylyltransferase